MYYIISPQPFSSRAFANPSRAMSGRESSSPRSLSPASADSVDYQLLARRGRPLPQLGKTVRATPEECRIPRGAWNRPGRQGPRGPPRAAAAAAGAATNARVARGGSAAVRAGPAPGRGHPRGSGIERSSAADQFAPAPAPPAPAPAPAPALAPREAAAALSALALALKPPPEPAPTPPPGRDSTASPAPAPVAVLARTLALTLAPIPAPNAAPSPRQPPLPPRASSQGTKGGAPAAQPPQPPTPQPPRARRLPTPSLPPPPYLASQQADGLAPQPPSAAGGSAGYQAKTRAAQSQPPRKPTREVPRPDLFETPAARAKSLGPESPPSAAGRSRAAPTHPGPESPPRAGGRRDVRSRAVATQSQPPSKKTARPVPRPDVFEARARSHGPPPSVLRTIPKWCSCPEQSRVATWTGGQQHVWRVMRGDSDDFKYCPIPQQGDIVYEALLSVHKGSRIGFRSHFLHASRDHSMASLWFYKARTKDPQCYMVKIDLAKWPSRNVIDLSTHALQVRFVGSRACDEQIQKLLHTQIR